MITVINFFYPILKLLTLAIPQIDIYPLILRFLPWHVNLVIQPIFQHLVIHYVLSVFRFVERNIVLLLFLKSLANLIQRCPIGMWFFTSIAFCLSWIEFDEVISFAWVRSFESVHAPVSWISFSSMKVFIPQMVIVFLCGACLSHAFSR